MSFEQLSFLYQLSQLDLEIDNIRKKAAAIDPGNKIVQQIREQQLVWNKHQSLLDTTNARIYELEAESEKINARIKQDKQSLYQSGNVSAKESENLEKNITSNEHRLGTIDDEMLELLDKKPTLETSAKTEKSKLENLKADLAKHQKEVRILQDTLKTNFDKLLQQRPSIAKNIETHLYKQYENIKRKHHDTGLAILNSDKGCSMCGMHIPEKILDSLDNNCIIQCESCSRILMKLIPNSN